MRNFIQKKFDFYKLLFLFLIFFTTSQIEAQNCFSLNSLFQTVGNQGTDRVDILKYDYVTQKFEYFTTLSSQVHYNSASSSTYNSNTKLLYVAEDPENNNNFVRVFDPANNFSYVGRFNVTGLGTTDFSNNLFSVGDKIGFRDNSSNANQLAMINVAGLDFTGTPIVPASLNNVSPDFNNNIAADYVHYNGLLYGIANIGIPALTSISCQLIIINPNTGDLTSRTLTIPPPDQNAGSYFDTIGTNGFGAVWIDSEGNFMAFNNNTGNVYRVEKVDQGTTVIKKILSAGISNKNDGFGCEFLPNVLTPIVEVLPPTCASDGIAKIKNYLDYVTYTFDPVTAGITITSNGTILGLTVGQLYTVNADNGLATSDESDPFSILAQLLPPVALSLSGSTICASPGGNGTITSTTSEIGVSYQLYDSANAPVQLPKAGTGSGLTWSLLSAGNGYHVTATNAATCTTPSNIVNIATTANPLAFSLIGSTICASPGGNGTITTTTSEIGVSYQLYNLANVAVQTAQAGTGGILTWSALPAGTGYYVIASIASCTTNSSNTVAVATTANPLAFSLIGSTICASPGGNGTITTTTSQNGVSYQLYNLANVAVQTAKAGTGGILTWSALPAGTSYYVIASIASCTTNSSNTVAVATTANPLAFSLTGSTICASPGGNGTITTTTSQNGVSYQLYDSANATVQSPKAGTGSGLTWSPLPAGNGYYVTATNAATCNSQSSSVNITTTANPLVPEAYVSEQPTCIVPTGTILITAPVPAANVTYTVTGTNPVVAPVTKSTTTFANLAPGDYTVTTTNTITGCLSDPIGLTVKDVQGSPAATVTAQPNCISPKGTIVITSPDPAANVRYTVTGINPVVAPVTKSTTTFTNLDTGDYTVTTTDTTTGCVSTATNLTVDIITPNPAAPTTTVTVEPTCAIRKGTILISNPAPAANVTYTLKGTSPVVVAVTQAFATFANLEPGNYDLITTNTITGCVSLPTAIAILIPTCPGISLIKTAHFNDENGDSLVQANETVTYNFTVTNTGNTILTNITISDKLPGIVINTGPGSLTLAVGESNSTYFTGTYTIKQSDINVGSISNQATIVGENPIGIVAGISTVVLELDPGSGCKITVYNVVTPNDDGKNDFLEIEGLECHADNTVEIYNRWGVLVFERNGYNNSDIAFKGMSEGRVTVKASELLPSGTYYYIIKYKDYDAVGHEKSGYLSINR
jgi:gliding motility-associated-like protein/uncharacterized repeat protein (TIGR01451 family)